MYDCTTLVVRYLPSASVIVLCLYRVLTAINDMVGIRLLSAKSHQVYHYLSHQVYHYCIPPGIPLLYPTRYTIIYPTRYAIIYPTRYTIIVSHQVYHYLSHQVYHYYIPPGISLLYPTRYTIIPRYMHTLCPLPWYIHRGGGGVIEMLVVHQSTSPSVQLSIHHALDKGYHPFPRILKVLTGIKSP